ncbi:MAG: DUF86 domain-containing protein [Candidatus Methanomethylophilaceae archaeon]|nr:DUF86 domain-containing protein [Candidatus Methanomethylophilaceae archaeon]MBP5394882.1 DUF86 domain-containing protein [Candidatus Methanomethylophilaceae archaeon]
MKNDSLNIEWMIHYCDAIIDDVSTINGNIELYLDDKTLQRSCSFSLLQIGEISKRVTEETKSKYSDVNWRAIAGLRDRIVHHYEPLSLYALWDIIINDVPVLKESLLHIEKDLKSLSDSASDVKHL